MKKESLQPLKDSGFSCILYNELMLNCNAFNENKGQVLMLRKAQKNFYKYQSGLRLADNI